MLTVHDARSACRRPVSNVFRGAHAAENGERRSEKERTTRATDCTDDTHGSRYSVSANEKAARGGGGLTGGGAIHSLGAKVR